MDPVDGLVVEPPVARCNQVELLYDAVLDCGGDPCVGSDEDPLEVAQRIPWPLGHRAFSLKSRRGVLAVDHRATSAASQTTQVAAGGHEVAVKHCPLREPLEQVGGRRRRVSRCFMGDARLRVEDPAQVERVGELTEVDEGVVLGLNRAGDSRQGGACDEAGGRAPALGVDCEVAAPLVRGQGDTLGGLGQGGWAG